MQIALLKNLNFIGFNPALYVLCVRFLFLSLLAIWVTGFLLPLVSTIDNPLTNFFISKLYSTVCHQDSIKCISIDNNSMLVCARCAGIYFGVLIAVIAGLFIIRPVVSKRLLLISILPLLIDVLLISLGIYSYSKLMALVTGIISGSVIYFFIIAEIEKFSLKQIFDMGNE